MAPSQLITFLPSSECFSLIVCMILRAGLEFAWRREIVEVLENAIMGSDASVISGDSGVGEQMSNSVSSLLPDTKVWEGGGLGCYNRWHTFKNYC